MQVVAYLYTLPWVDLLPEQIIWGWEIDQLYQDVAGAAQPRANLQRLLQTCETQPPAYVLVRDLSELGDSPGAATAVLATLEQAGVIVVALGQDYMTPTADPPSDRAAMMTLAAAIQTQQRRQRLQAGHARNRIHALPPPGRAPYGYRRGKERYTLDRATAPVVKDFFEQFLLFGSVRGAVRYLAKTYGKRISVSTGRRWLTNPVYRGDLVYLDGRVVQNTHAPILPRDEAAQVDRLLRRNRRLPPRSASAPRSLAGLVQCQECHSKLRVSRVSRPRQTQDYLYLRPMACGRSPQPCKAIPYDAVLAQTIEAVCRDLPTAIATVQNAPIGRIKLGLMAQVEQKEGILAQIPDLLTSGVLDAETAALRTYKLRSEMAMLQQQLAQLPPENLQEIAQTLSIPQFWQDLSEAERRVYLREFIRQIEVLRDGTQWRIQIQFVF